MKSKLKAKLVLATFLGVAGSAAMALGLPSMASATTTVVVTPATPQGWITADTRPGGTVSYVADSTAPGEAALRLTTDATNGAKAQYMHEASTPLAEVTDLSYSTKQNSASFIGGDASYQLVTLVDGTQAGYTTFVYEPYENGLVTPGTWQSWDVKAGQFWSSRTVTCPGGTIPAGAGGAPYFTLAQIKMMCPDAVVVGFGVNIGRYNPSYDVESDLVNFNGTVYDFQLTNVPADKDQCKSGGYVNYTDAQGRAFKNQGQCVSTVAGKGKS